MTPTPTSGGERTMRSMRPLGFGTAAGALLAAFTGCSASESGALQHSFEEHSVLWLLVSSTLGGILGASFKWVFEVVLPHRLQQRREVIAIKRKYATPILLAAL